MFLGKDAVESLIGARNDDRQSKRAFLRELDNDAKHFSGLPNDTNNYLDESGLQDYKNKKALQRGLKGLSKESEREAKQLREGKIDSDNVDSVLEQAARDPQVAKSAYLGYRTLKVAEVPEPSLNVVTALLPEEPAPKLESLPLPAKNMDVAACIKQWASVTPGQIVDCIQNYGGASIKEGLSGAQLRKAGDNRPNGLPGLRRRPCSLLMNL